MPETKPMTASAYVDLQVAEDAPADHPPPELFLTWATPVAQHHERPIEVSIRLVSRAESAALNHQYRGKSTPTNVLSFPFEAPPGIDWNEPFVGDLAVCVDLMA
ncbi:MAG: rRNA maturation RNase YbeY, partial [Natronospirillum sp.]